MPNQSAQSEIHRIAICVATYRRPDGLRKLLNHLQQLTFTGEPPRIELIVVDNDPDGSAKVVCEKLQADDQLSMRYEHEPNRGISNARNAALRAVPKNVDLIAFLDDDEWPSAQWLDDLMTVMTDTHADVVTGPVQPVFDGNAPRWIVEGGFFDPPELERGAVRDRAFTGNVLFRPDVLGKAPGWFDKRFNSTGGEDSHFFQRAHRAGCRIVWTPDAIVYEDVPNDRASPDWIVRRSYRGASMSAIIARDLRPGVFTSLLIVAKSVVWFGIGFTKWVIGLVAGRVMRLRGRKGMAYARGLIAGLCGRPFAEYA